jgi:hypothetical protein
MGKQSNAVVVSVATVVRAVKSIQFVVDIREWKKNEQNVSANHMGKH